MEAWDISTTRDSSNTWDNPITNFDNISDGAILLWLKNPSGNEIYLWTKNGKARWSRNTVDNMFANFTSLEYVDTSKLLAPTSEIHDASFMFKNCHNLKSIDLSTLKSDYHENLIDGESMFEECNELTHIYVRKAHNDFINSDSRYTFEGCYKLVGGNKTCRW